MFEADITKVVEEMAVRIRETEEDFIIDTIFPYCQETLQRKINKAELKQIILRGSRPRGRWIGHGEHCENLGVMPSGLSAYEWCSNCDCGIDVREWHRNHYNFCPNCGADMSGGENNGNMD